MAATWAGMRKNMRKGYDWRDVENEWMANCNLYLSTTVKHIPEDRLDQVVLMAQLIAVDRGLA